MEGEEEGKYKNGEGEGRRKRRRRRKERRTRRVGKELVCNSNSISSCILCCLCT